MHRCDHRDLQFAPLPDDVLDEVGKTVRALRQISKRKQGVAFDDRHNPLDVEASTKTAALARQYDGAYAPVLF